MSINESIEYFPIFDPETTADSPGLSAAGGSGIAAVRAPDALGGAGAVVLYFYSAAQNGWGYVGVLAGSKIGGAGEVRALGSSCLAFGDTVIVGAQGDAAHQVECSFSAPHTGPGATPLSPSSPSSP